MYAPSGVLTAGRGSISLPCYRRPPRVAGLPERGDPEPMPRSAALISLAFLIAATSAATSRAPVEENGSLGGKVVDGTTGLPVNAASVAVKGTPLRGSSDGNGAFFIDNVPLGAAVIQVSRVGYKSREISVAVTADDATQWTIALAKLKH